MTAAVPDILSRIVAHKVEGLADRAPFRAQWEGRAEAMRAGRRDFRKALEQNSPAIIAEIKKASPSKGVLAPDFNPIALALDYQEGGAAALSVLTDESFFQGSLADLSSAREAVRIPVLRKDFTLDEIHILEAAAHGADAVLLIAAILEERKVRELREMAEKFGMAALVEVHDSGEIDKALSAGAGIIGVNNRNLATFEVSLETSLRLVERIPDGVIRISESGIHSAADVRRLQSAGFHAFLVGEHLMKAGNRGEALRALKGKS